MGWERRLLAHAVLTTNRLSPLGCLIQFKESRDG
jgi:hypothetical protein